MEIRNYQASDIEELIPLYADLGYPVTAEVLRKRLGILLHQPSYQLLVAVLDEKVVGFIGFSKLYFFERDGFYYRILALVVGTNYRNQGVAGRLIDEVRERAYFEGASALALNSGIRAERSEAHRFYQNYGFKKTSSGFALDLS
ncbi:GNAT family N-acetyltransferase [Streptococcus mutans]|uniref:GNAT family N-acetyltransferase n=1 Tax=Streptococcus mutans TaxID=1309 RepID=UPI0004646601|nr:GNAT family N-acetyltransferase [Streptococcus mutans]NLQ35966.1 GNAT family N-acetyltransferase [Streptococcus mutans]